MTPHRGGMTPHRGDPSSDSIASALTSASSVREINAAAAAVAAAKASRMGGVRDSAVAAAVSAAAAAAAASASAAAGAAKAETAFHTPMARNVYGLLFKPPKVRHSSRVLSGRQQPGGVTHATVNKGRPPLAAPTARQSVASLQDLGGT